MAADYADVQLQIAQWRVNLPMLTEIFAGLAEQYPMMAKQYRLYYTALIDAGFSPSDALEIVKLHGVFPRIGGDAPGPKGA